MPENNLLIYILERSNPDYHPEPEIFTDPDKAVDTVRKEYEKTAEELGIPKTGVYTECECGFQRYDCNWEFLESNPSGTCTISSNLDSDRYKWRVTARTIDLGYYKKRQFIKTIAENFLDTMNPTRWDGKGDKPDSVCTKIKTYDIHSCYNNELDISLEYCNNSWTFYLELRNKITEDLMLCLHADKIDSTTDLTDAILELCEDEINTELEKKSC